MRLGKWYGATLHVLHVMPPLPASDVSMLAASGRALTERNLRTLVERTRINGVAIETDIAESADAAARIIEGAESHDVDMIVTGSHGRTGMQRVVLGSVVEALLHKARRPVLTIPSHIDLKRIANATSIGRIVCAVDFSVPSLAGLAFAFALAEEADATLTLLHVIELPPELHHTPRPLDADIFRIRAEAEAECRARLQALIPERARDYCTVETDVLEGGAAREILRLAGAQDADLIVLGVHGRNAFDLAFFGSNSKDVIRQAHCPVLVVPESRRATLSAAS
jgi:nucleotide-binding universal stress UspA family protein